MSTKQNSRDLIIDNLANVFRSAEAAALAADPGPDADGGTCNFDSPVFRVHGMRRANIEQAVQRAGLTVSCGKWMGQNWYWLNVTMRGQAHRRTVMMEAALRVLRAACPSDDRPGVHPGFAATGYYQMD